MFFGNNGCGSLLPILVVLVLLFCLCGNNNGNNVSPFGGNGCGPNCL